MAGDISPNALALAGVQPNVDLVGPMKSVAELQMAQAHSMLYGAQAKFQIMRQNALAQASQLKQKGDPNWFDPIAAVDPEAAKHMQEYDWTQRTHQAATMSGQQENAGDSEAAARTRAGYPELRDTLAKASQALTTSQQTAMKTQFEGIGQTSQAFLDAYGRFKRGEITKDDLRKVWNEQSSRARKLGAMNDLEYNSMYDMPNPDAAAEKARQGLMLSIGVKDVFEHGEGAQKKAEAELPSKTKVVEAEGEQHRLTQAEKLEVVPPGHAATTTKMLKTGQVPAGVENMPDETKVAPGNMGQVGADLPHPNIPAVPLGTNDPRFLVQGTDPQTQERMKVASTHYEKDVKIPGMMAYAQRADLNEMENLIASGKVQSNVAANMKEQMAGWVYAIMGGGTGDAKADAVAAERAKAWTGIDVANQAVFNKASTKMGLNFARATEGAREAVAAIKIALGANPQSTNPREANLKIIRLMKAANQYTIDNMAYQNKYYEKNKHYVGAEESFAEQRTPEMYTSRVDPFPVPQDQRGGVDVRRMQPNVVYHYQDKHGKNVAGIWDGNRFLRAPY